MEKEKKVDCETREGPPIVDQDKQLADLDPDNQAEKEAQSFKVNFKLFAHVIFYLDITETDTLSDLRHYINEFPLLKLHPNHTFTCNGKALNEIEPLLSQITPPDSDINLEFVKFTAYTAEKHIRNCCLFFLNPQNFFNENLINFYNLLNRHDYVPTIVKNQEVYIPELPLEYVCSNDHKYNQRVSFSPSHAEFPELFFKNMGYSQFNPVIKTDQVKGVLFYIDLTTLEGNYYCISVSTGGIFCNKSINNGFNPCQSTKSHLSLFSLLQAISVKFTNEFTKFYKLKDFELNLPSPEVNYDSKKSRALINLNEMLRKEFAGHVLTQFKDWNEEFQSAQGIPTPQFSQQLQKLKIVNKISNEFQKSASDLAKVIVDGGIPSLNPTNNIFEACFVYNNLFATYAEDKLNWEQSKTDTAPTTYAAVNNDLKYLKLVQSLNILGLNTIDLSVVDYKGKRIVIQSLVQGILHYDPVVWSIYGSVDEGKTIRCDEELHPILEDLCKHFSIKANNRFLDKEGSEYIINGSLEIKGIKAGDGRKYLMDFMRLGIRDANFPDPVSHECALIRPELLRQYILANSINKTEKEDTLSFNPSIFTQLESQNPDIDQERKLVCQIGEFLVNSVIPQVCKDLRTSHVFDISTLVSFLHDNGVNLRYIGKIFTEFKKDSDFFLYRLIEKTVLIRSLRKLLRQIAISIEWSDLLEIIVHYVNIILGHGPEEEVNPVKKESKKTKKKKKGGLGIVFANEKASSIKLLNKKELFAELSAIAETRYGFQKDYFESGNLNFIKTFHDKLNFLNEFGKLFGISFLINSLPIKVDDIVDAFPVIKNGSIVGDQLRMNLFVAESELSKGNIGTAEQILNSQMILMANTLGILSKDFYKVLSKLASIEILKNNLSESLKLSSASLRIKELTSGFFEPEIVSMMVQLCNSLYDSGRKTDSKTLHIATIYCSDVVSGTINQLSLTMLHELSLLFEETKEFNEAIKVCEELLRRNVHMFGECDERLVYILGKLSKLKGEIGEFKEATLYLARKNLILKRILKSNKYEHDARFKTLLSNQIDECEKMKGFFMKKLTN